MYSGYPHEFGSILLSIGCSGNAAMITWPQLISYRTSLPDGRVIRNKQKPLKNVGKLCRILSIPGRILPRILRKGEGGGVERRRGGSPNFVKNFNFHLKFGFPPSFLLLLLLRLLPPFPSSFFLASPTSTD